MTHGSLFSGIGGFDLAAEWMGWENVFHCEIGEFGQKILKYYWPLSISHGDITKTEFNVYRGRIDVLSGGFPCQPFSTAGEQKGDADERYLFEEMLRAVREIQPTWILAENVRNLTSGKFSKLFDKIWSSLEAEGYAVQPIIIPATAVGAEHERYRVWIIAHAKRGRLQGQGSLRRQLQPEKIGDRETNRFVNSVQRNALSFVCSSHYGFPRKLAEQAIHGAGNAIVPQIAYEIFKAIEQYELINLDVFTR